MKLLLDTHVWLWSLLEPSRISPHVSDAIANTQNELWLSPISIWELVLLVEKGRLLLSEGLGGWLRKTWAALPVIEASLTTEVALALLDVNLAHRDPADRFLVATARVYDLTLVTADHRLMGSRDWKVLPNR